MQLSEWAENILKGQQLEDKLSPLVDSRLDSKPYSGRIPEWPARPARLSIVRRPLQNNKIFRGTQRADLERAAIFHFFANHELLALELMALALLKFNDAPPSFRRGIATTIQDEQKHLKKYISRMHELGVEFGDMPLNSFFWRALSPMTTPEQFVCNMSLTFEQANLDYALFYENEFQKLGDVVSALILREVYEDEISHVHFGNRWLQYYRPIHITSWDFYQEQLLMPITPARAKGKCFDIKGRKRAGLDRKFIDSVKIYNRSKGKPPVLYFFNLASSANRASRAIADDLATLFLFVAGPHDAVHLENRPDHEFLTTLSRRRPVAEIITTRAQELRTVERIESYRPMTRTQTQGICTKLQIKTQQSSSYWPHSDSKIFTKKIATTLGLYDDLNYVSPSEAKTAPFALMVKGETGAAGQANLYVPAHGFKKSEKLICKIQDRFGQLTYEPYHQRLADFSLLFDTAKENFVTIQTICDRRGRFVGVWNRHALFSDLIEPVRRQVFHGDHLNFQASSKMTAGKIRSHLKQMGYQGRGSIDGYIYQDNDGKLHLRSICEINCRWTMGHFFLHFRHLLPRPSIWLLLNQSDCRHLNCENFVDLYEILKRRFTDVMATNPPSSARKVLSVLIHDQDLIQKLKADPFFNSKCFISESWLESSEIP